MAEFDGLDSRLRDALGRAAQPGDSAGVADAIRSRLAAGDPGISVASSTAPGWGGSVLGWLPWLALVVVAGIGGTALGASGLVGAEQQSVIAGYTVVLDDTAPAYACPGGPAVGSLSAGDRVLAVARSEDSGWLGVRDPNAFDRTLWFERAIVVVDSGQADVATLPVEACPVVAVEIVPPAPAPEESQAPAPGDTTAPKVVQAGASPSTIGSGFNSDTSTLSAVATDNVGVSRIDATWPTVDFIPAGSRTISGSSGSFVFGPVAWNGSYGYADRVVPITFVAVDGAGNSSAPVTVNVTVHYVLG